MPVFKRNSVDGLTSLPSREAFFSNVGRLLAHADIEDLSMVYMRLQNLGSYGLRYGAAAGDEAIKIVADQLKQFAPAKRLGRFESGGFAALLPTEEVQAAIEAVNNALPARDDADGLACKAGYCELRRDFELNETMQRARYAYEDIRYNNRVYSRFFDEGLERAFTRRSYCVDHLDEAIERGEIRAYAQPIIRVLTGMICEVEVLARWESDEFGFLRPDEFVPELERNQLIHKLDAEVVRLACKQWKEASDLGINVPFGINLSRLDFELADMYAVVTEAMRAYDVPIEQVHVEITESAFSHSSELLSEGIDRFRKAGFKLYLDDFGSGYSSLSVLEGTMFDVVKLDMSLLQEVEVNERARVIVADAVSMVKRLALQTLCEGVETEDQFLFLKAVGCEKAQGYYFSRPVSHEEIMSHLFETAELHERPEDTRYYDSIGKVNLIDGTRSTLQSVEAAHFMGTQPFAIVEVLDQHVHFLLANSAFRRFVSKWRAQSIDQIEERLGGDMSDVRSKGVYAASKVIATGQPQQFDFIAEGQVCTLGVSHVETSEGRQAFLLEVLSVTRYSQYNNFKVLEQSLGFLYTIFKRIDLLDLTDSTWRNIYLNVPRYNAIRVDETPDDEIEAFCKTFIHPDDRQRFMSFYDLSTIDQRLAESPTNHLADVFFAVGENDRYDMHIFMLIPVQMGEHRQFLSCMRDLDLDLDLAGTARQRLSGEDRVSDEVLLSGILDVTDRNIFWKDTHRRFLGANRRFLDYYGLVGVSDILGKRDDDLGWATNDERFVDDEMRVLRGERVVNVRGTTIRGDGQRRDIEVAKMPLVREGRVVGLVGFFRDLGPHE